MIECAPKSECERRITSQKRENRRNQRVQGAIRSGFVLVGWMAFEILGQDFLAVPLNSERGVSSAWRMNGKRPVHFIFYLLGPRFFRYFERVHSFKENWPTPAVAISMRKMELHECRGHTRAQSIKPGVYTPINHAEVIADWTRSLNEPKSRPLLSFSFDFFLSLLRNCSSNWRAQLSR